MSFAIMEKMNNEKRQFKKNCKKWGFKIFGMPPKTHMEMLCVIEQEKKKASDMASVPKEMINESK